MNFNAPLLKPIRILLFPISLVYALVVWIRNRCYDHNIFRSTSFNLPIICVGNLSAGGTGKSSMIELLLAELQTDYHLAVLSRGYKRKTRGYALAGPQTTALEIGDEPMQFFNKFPQVTVAVGEERIVAIPQLLHDRPQTDVILLDDAFQHRSVTAGLNILLTEYGNLFTRDWYLPTGDLRDEVRSRRRAQIIVITKCPPGLTERESDELRAEVSPLSSQHLFFSTLQYGRPYHILTKKPMMLDGRYEALLVTGIANPAPLKKYVHEHSRSYEEMLFGDHHIFSIDDWKEIGRRFHELSSPNKLIITTEKDAVRLIKFGAALESLPIFVLPVKMRFLFDGDTFFIDLIAKFINEFKLQTKFS